MVSIRPRTNRIRTSVLLVTTCTLIAAGGVQARDGDWYVGAGASAALLRPDAVLSGFDTDDDPVGGATLFVGHDIDDRTSVQLQLHGLGEIAFGSGEAVEYLGADAAVLYRFIDTRDRLRQFGARSQGANTLGLALYGRFGLGVLERDTTIELENDADVHFGIGGGAELYLTDHLALRADAIFHDTDAASFSIGVVARFGSGARVRPALVPPAPPVAPIDTDVPETTRVPLPAPLDGPLERTDRVDTDTGPTSDIGSGEPPTPARPPVPEPPVPEPPVPEPPESRLAEPEPPAPETAVPEAAPEPAPPVIDDADIADVPFTRPDGDGDGIGDERDVCPASVRGFPVRENGCPVLDGVLSGVRFTKGTAILQAGGTEQLDYLVELLTDYPSARIELHAHTDNTGTEAEQSILTRERLRTIGMYLVQERGVRANRLVLRSFGGARPLEDNGTPQGRSLNNRIEVIEHTE